MVNPACSANWPRVVAVASSAACARCDRRIIVRVTRPSWPAVARSVRAASHSAETWSQPTTHASTSALVWASRTPPMRVLSWASMRRVSRLTATSASQGSGGVLALPKRLHSHPAHVRSLASLLSKDAVNVGLVLTHAAHRLLERHTSVLLLHGDLPPLLLIRRSRINPGRPSILDTEEPHEPRHGRGDGLGVVVHRRGTVRRQDTQRSTGRDVAEVRADVGDGDADLVGNLGAEPLEHGEQVGGIGRVELDERARSLDAEDLVPGLIEPQYLFGGLAGLGVDEDARGVVHEGPQRRAELLHTNDQGRQRVIQAVL